MNTKKWLGVSGVLIFGFLATARAELKWQETEVELHPKASDATAVAQYHYENVGDKPVHIASVKTSCGCTVATLKSNDVAPGDKGEITATFNIAGHTGLQHKMITVLTDDTAKPSTVLTLTANVPKLVDVEPIFVFWNSNEKLKPKTITVTASDDSKITDFTASSSSPQISAEIKPGKKPHQWIVRVTPKAGGDPFAANVALKPEGGPGRVQLSNVGVRVLARPPAAH